MKNIKHLCDYGCGQEAKYQFKNGKWCCSKSHNICPKIIEKRIYSKEGRKKLRDKMLGENNPCYKKIYTEEEKECMADSLRKWWADPKNIPIIKERNKKLSIKNKGQIPWVKGRKLTESHKKKLKKTPEQKEILRKKSLANFQDEKFLKKFIKGCHAKPNRHEKFMIDYLFKLNVNFKYVGNFKKWIGGKNPDFIDENNKKLIEYFGRYWHSNDDEIIRINHFKKYGYNTLVIWEEELQDLISLKQKIFQFVI